LSLEFVHRGLSLARLETPYVSGWYEKLGGKLYVNRGIGTTGPPSGSVPDRKSRYSNSRVRGSAQGTFPAGTTFIQKRDVI
jgi:hypothetical protein